MLCESREILSVRDAPCNMCLIYNFRCTLTWKWEGKILEESSSECLGKLSPKQLKTLWSWQQERWERWVAAGGMSRTQHSTPTMNVHFEYVPGLFCSLSSVKHWEPTHVCSFHRKGSATREASSTESLKNSWSRVETLPKEMELEVSLAK